MRALVLTKIETQMEDGNPDGLIVYISYMTNLCECL